MMSTLLRVGPWRVMIYVKDHGPAHVHVVGPDGRARIALNCPDGPPIPIDARGMDAIIVKRIVEVIIPEVRRLCKVWRTIHGSS